MKLKHLLIINTVVCLVYGIILVLSPATMLSLHGVAQDPGTRLMAQYFGSTLITMGLLTWFARNVADSEAQGVFILALLIGSVIGIVISVFGTVSGPMNAVGWSVVAIYILMALGFGYLQFMKPGAS